MKVTIHNRTLELIDGDITDQPVDAIVNAANKHLQLGSGVAGAIRRRGGPSIQAECDQIGHCPVGDAVITTAGNLPANHVIHAVGPRASNPDADALLASATRRSLNVAAENHLSSIALPAISTGVFGFPIDRCAELMLAEIINDLKSDQTSLQHVVMCLWGAQAFGVFEAELKRQTDQSA
ncbi:MAG: macro domain-containing protein [Chloroflexi bacterium]|nr:macro domain-containing protein [Chloroflexota bacterium]